MRHDLYLGDCEAILKQLPDHSVDLIFTSPPYADQRKKTYGDIHDDRRSGRNGIFEALRLRGLFPARNADRKTVTHVQS